MESINNKNSNILTKRPPVATTVPSGAIIGALVYRGIPSKLVSRYRSLSEFFLLTLFQVQQIKQLLFIFSRPIVEQKGDWSFAHTVLSSISSLVHVRISVSRHKVNTTFFTILKE